VTRRGPPASTPPGLRALASEDGEEILLSFELLARSSAQLSPAESEIVTHLLAGRSNAEIGTLRGTSTRTVANQVAAIFAKLGVRSRTELAASAAIFKQPGFNRSPDDCQDD
jgi:DNA-binding CsgD family transcriptional regulator